FSLALSVVAVIPLVVVIIPAREVTVAVISVIAVISIIAVITIVVVIAEADVDAHPGGDGFARTSPNGRRAEEPRGDDTLVVNGSHERVIARPGDRGALDYLRRCVPNRGGEPPPLARIHRR